MCTACSDIHKVSETNDKNMCVIALERDNGSQDYYLFNRGSKELTMLFTAQPKVGYYAIEVDREEGTSRKLMVLSPCLSA